MSEGQRSAVGLIGPNAVLQMLPQIERIGGRARVDQMLAAAGMFERPDGTTMIPETDAARLHRLLREEEPELAPELAVAAGLNTAQYLLDNRIPRPAHGLLRALAPPVAAFVLSRAIRKNAWTFVGSGGFSLSSPWVFEIRDNPVIRGEISDTPLCAWHAAVFEGLYRALVDPRCRCTEMACCAQPDSRSCRFRMEIVYAT